MRGWPFPGLVTLGPDWGVSAQTLVGILVPTQHLGDVMILLSQGQPALCRVLSWGSSLVPGWVWG